MGFYTENCGNPLQERIGFIWLSGSPLGRKSAPEELHTKRLFLLRLRCKETARHGSVHGLVTFLVENLRHGNEA
jgi:hypothetical protein